MNAAWHALRSRFGHSRELVHCCRSRCRAGERPCAALMPSGTVPSRAIRHCGPKPLGSVVSSVGAGHGLREQRWRSWATVVVALIEHEIPTTRDAKLASPHRCLFLAPGQLRTLPIGRNRRARMRDIPGSDGLLFWWISTRSLWVLRARQPAGGAPAPSRAYRPSGNG